MTYFRSGGTNHVDWRKSKLTVSNVVSYAKAEASLAIHGPVAPEVFEARKATCMGCEFRATNTTPPDEIGFCTKCGCGASNRARLTVKATMPAATCPMGKWGSGVATSDGGNDAHTVYEEGDAGDEHD